MTKKVFYKSELINNPKGKKIRQIPTNRKTNRQ